MAACVDWAGQGCPRERKVFGLLLCSRHGLQSVCEETAGRRPRQDEWLRGFVPRGRTLQCKRMRICVVQLTMSKSAVKSIEAQVGCVYRVYPLHLCAECRVVQIVFEDPVREGESEFPDRVNTLLGLDWQVVLVAASEVY